MTKQLIRCSLLLFVVSFVGLIGLNRAVDPRNVARIYAHDITIELSSSGNGDLTFAASATCNAAALAPSDICIADVLVENTGEGDITLSEPEIEVTGPLTTCGGGGHLTGIIDNLSYEPDDSVLDVGDDESFEVIIEFALAAPNDCQGLAAEIIVTIEATATDDGDEDEDDDDPDDPDEEEAEEEEDEDEDEDDPTPTPTLVSQTLASTPTAVPTVRPSPVPTFISEVAPARFPVTGHADAGLSRQAQSIAKTIFIGFGLLGAGVLLFAVANRKRDAR
jgi:hypothetical protein